MAAVASLGTWWGRSSHRSCCGSVIQIQSVSPEGEVHHQRSLKWVSSQVQVKVPLGGPGGRGGSDSAKAPPPSSRKIVLVEEAAKEVAEVAVWSNPSWGRHHQNQLFLWKKP